MGRKNNSSHQIKSIYQISIKYLLDHNLNFFFRYYNNRSLSPDSHITVYGPYDPDTDITDSCKWLNKVITSYWLNSLRKFIYTYLKRELDTRTAAYPQLKLVELKIGKVAPKIKNIACHNSSKVRTHRMFSRILNL